LEGTVSDEELFRVLESQTTAGRWRQAEGTVRAAVWAGMTTIAEPLLRVWPVRWVALAVGDAIVRLGDLGRTR
jgi:hypothetical protein